MSMQPSAFDNQGSVAADRPTGHDSGIFWTPLLRSLGWSLPATATEGLCSCLNWLYRTGQRHTFSQGVLDRSAATYREVLLLVSMNAVARFAATLILAAALQ
ncbi:hypothetical protein XM38_010250 [Halomicronema hongdechloris C2206]|uniref:Uncharacterized protein n=1 Tax=Halomicronema hongdechloris C2206 TaxID=1641165 RepID=A0A1Z3HIG8_9CYAN|nr:hypothetical protein [Halomicronema hongdechloris]ASC70095.1 hypothetical protein XM38_010250 [Halomicronema hongdechloris C2206]